MARRRRAPKSKKINPTFYIFCEGETEKAYISMLRSYYRLPTINIDSQIGGNNISKRYIDNYKQGLPTHDKDQDFLMYDLDVPRILQRLTQIPDCILLLSNPCLELWFFLHYKNQSSRTNCDYCCGELSKRNRGYKKRLIDKKLRSRLIEKMPVAIKRANKLDSNENPSTNVFELIQILEDLR